jgi:pimeloyl-ACP methyl ester carboxylesterase
VTAMFRHLRGTPRLGWLRLAALLGLVALSVAGSSSVAATSRRLAGAHHAARPTIVLVHGAWADGSSWAAVIRRLQRRGYTVAAPPNPLRGLAADSAYLGAFLHTISGPVVLVGHSYGGAVITNAAADAPNVKALVYVSAFAPDEGESLLQLVSAQPGSALAPAAFDTVPIPGGGGDVDLYVKPSVFPQAFANDLPEWKAAVLAATQRPLAASAAAEPSGPPAWKTIPSWYLVASDDHVLPAAEQRFMAARAHARTVEIAASHLSMISRPRDVTRLIEAAAASVQ